MHQQIANVLARYGMVHYQRYCEIRKRESKTSGLGGGRKGGGRVKGSRYYV